MWHFLEHDYDPMRTLRTARDLLAPNGRLVIEVPRLDSTTFRLYGDRWPGLQAPQHTVLFDRSDVCSPPSKRPGLEVVEYLPYGAFPAFFYFFAGAAFKLLRGKGLNLSRAIYPYFLGQILFSPILAFEKQLNFAMQTVVCRRRDMSRARTLLRVGAQRSSFSRSASLVMLDRRDSDARSRAALLLRGHRPLDRRRRAARSAGIRYRVHGAPASPSVQTIYVSNHTSTLDVFLLIALGAAADALLPQRLSAEDRCRSASSARSFESSGRCRRSFPSSRREIFKRADRILRETGDSVYLSPEGHARHDRRDRRTSTKARFIWRRACTRRSFRSTSRFRARSIRAWATTRSPARSTSTFCRRSIRRRGSSPTSSEIATRCAICSCASTTRCARRASFPSRSRS